MILSVIIHTYNPGLERLGKTLSALRAQSLAASLWELIIIDNNSSNGFSAHIDLSWHPSAKIVTEARQGLTYARLKGFQVSLGRIIVMVDDDNLLNSDYLQKVVAIFNDHPLIGVIGGRSLPLFEARPPEWIRDFYGSLALRDLGSRIATAAWENTYPAIAPIGAGMALRKAALVSYIQSTGKATGLITDRTATSLASGGDNEINIEILRSGWQVGYFPDLVLQHIIPADRMEPAYLGRLINHTNKSWVQLLEKQGINPWPKIPAWSTIPRKIKAWFTYKAWQNKPNYIKWRGACGLYDGLADKS